MKKLYILILMLVTFFTGVVCTSFVYSSGQILDEAINLSKVNILMWDTWDTLDEESRREFNQLIAMHLNRYRIASQTLPDFLKTKKMSEEICLSFVVDNQKAWNKYKAMLIRDGLYEYVKDTISHCRYHYDI